MEKGFDHVASTYDETFTHTLTGKEQREIVWKYLDKISNQSQNILEINCGTGEDALHLAKHGHSVFATDGSPEMLRIVNEKINSQDQNVRTGAWDLNKPFPFTPEKFDIVFSNFGGLNCLSPESIKRFSQECIDLLNKNGKLIFVLMGRFCLMETLSFLLKGKFKEAFRRRNRDGVRAAIGNGQSIEIFYYSPSEIARLFSGFRVVKKIPVGSFIPPSYLDPFMKKHLWLFKFLSGLERIVSGIGFFALLSDHYLIELQTEP